MIVKMIRGLSTKWYWLNAKGENGMTRDGAAWLLFLCVLSPHFVLSLFLRRKNKMAGFIFLAPKRPAITPDDPLIA